MGAAVPVGFIVSVEKSVGPFMGTGTMIGFSTIGLFSGTGDDVTIFGTLAGF